MKNHRACPSAARNASSDLLGPDPPPVVLSTSVRNWGPKTEPTGITMRPAGSEPLDEGRRNMAGDGGHEIPSKWAALRPAKIAVADPGLDVVVAEIHKTAAPQSP